MRYALDSIADIFSDGAAETDHSAWHEPRSQYVAAPRCWMLRLFQPSTTSRCLTALRGVVKAAWRLALLYHETLEQTVHVSPVRGKHEIKGRATNADELATFIVACSSDSGQALGVRDAAFFALLCGAGLRCAEAAGALVDNFDASHNRLRISDKSDKDRNAFLTPQALATVVASPVRQRKQLASHA